MLNVKFQNHMPSCSVEEHFYKDFAIYSHDDHLGCVTWIVYINFLRTLNMKLGFDSPSGFREENL